jgi:ubiquitin C-terminal hydrolase
MNASLQCLTNIQSLSDELLQMHSQNKINTNQHPLTFAYTNLLYEFKTTFQSYIIPKSFKEVLEVLNPLFKGNQAADAKDLIFFIIERLHQELKPPEISLNNFNQIDFMQQEIEARNEELTRQKFLNELKLKNTSIISKTFHGIQRSIMKCEGCGNVKYSFQNFNILNFILKKIKEDKKNQLGDFLPNNYSLTLLDCFDSENKLEKLEGENMIYCNSCKALKSGSIKQDIYKLPKILVIVLNRGKNNQDFREEFKLEQILDLENQNTIICNPQTYKKYFLCGIVTHLGESGSNGHFISYFRNSLNQNFLCYNDASVAEVGVQDAMKSKISFREDEDMIPYILFYHCFRS